MTEFTALAVAEMLIVIAIIAGAVVLTKSGVITMAVIGWLS